ncbi:MAG: helix-turn-helix domain-containing protein [Bacteroides stercoris]|nr:helix-turn-helix domain-containing protein [Bacteroides stercoris]
MNALDLKEAFLQWNAEQKEESFPILQEEYKTPNETAKMLDVDKSTLWRWAKQGYLVPVKWGNKSRYKLSDIRCCMEG